MTFFRRVNKILFRCIKISSRGKPPNWRVAWRARAVIPDAFRVCHFRLGGFYHQFRNKTKLNNQENTLTPNAPFSQLMLYLANDSMVRVWHFVNDFLQTHVARFCWCYFNLQFFMSRHRPFRKDKVNLYGVV